MATMDGGEVDHLAAERATAQFDLDHMKVAWAGSRHAVDVNVRMARLVASDPVFRKDTRTMVSRMELFKDTLKKAAHAWKRVVELRLTEEEANLLRLYVDQPGYVDLHWIMARAVAAFNFAAFLEKEKLKTSGSNFTDWHRNLRIILAGCKNSYVLDAPLGEPPTATASPLEAIVYETRSDDYTIVKCAILTSLEPDLQKRFELHGAYEMVEELKTMFQTQARAERYEISEKFFTSKMEEHSSVSEHAITMTGYIQRLTQLGCLIPDELNTDRVLQSLPPSYKGFVLNYNMQGMKKSVPELFAMLKSAEVDIKKEHQVLMVNKTTGFKKAKGKKGKFKKGGKPVANPEKKPKSGPKPDTECFYCKGDGHWKRNCPKYLADKKAGNVKGTTK